MSISIWFNACGILCLTHFNSGILCCMSCLLLSVCSPGAENQALTKRGSVRLTGLLQSGYLSFCEESRFDVRPGGEKVVLWLFIIINHPALHSVLSVLKASSLFSCGPTYIIIKHLCIKCTVFHDSALIQSLFIYNKLWKCNCQTCWVKKSIK